MSAVLERPTYAPWSIKRDRRSKAEMDAIRSGILAVLMRTHPQTDRQIFYQLVNHQLIEKSEKEYKGTVVRLITEMRESGTLKWSWIADHTRWTRKSQSYDGPRAALEATATAYRRAVWASQPYYVEVWSEKDTLAGLLMEATDPYDVPLMVAKGFSSRGYLHSSAESIEATGKPARIFLLTDHDPSGIRIAQDIEKAIRRYAPESDIAFERLGITLDQVERYHLPTRPTKTEGNSHAKGFVGDSIELDALPARVLVALVREALESLIDYHALHAVQVAEESERKVFATLRGYLDREPGTVTCPRCRLWSEASNLDGMSATHYVTRTCDRCATQFIVRRLSDGRFDCTQEEDDEE